MKTAEKKQARELLNKKLFNNEGVKEIAWHHARTREEVIDNLQTKISITRRGNIVNASIDFTETSSNVSVRDRVSIITNKQ